MNRSRRAALAALCVLALALGAATLDSPVADDGGFGGSGSGGIVDAPGPETGGSMQNGTRDVGALIDIRAACIPFFTSSTFFYIVLGLSLVVAAFAYRRGGVLLVFAIFGTLFPPGLVLWMLVTTCGRDFSLSQRSQNFTIFPGTNGTISTGPAGGGGPGSSLPSLSMSILLILGIAIVLVGFLLLRASDDDIQEHEEESLDDEDVPASLAGLAGVAGEAADRIESGSEDTENEVYRAWREMTDLLAVDAPRTSTPAEFRDAATRAGMSERHVSALTDLFRDVRYGGAEASEDRESRAVDALRSIEETYGGEHAAELPDDGGHEQRGDDGA